MTPKIQGNLAVTMGDATALKFALAADGIDIDRYLAPDTGTVDAGAKAAAHTKAPDKPEAVEKPMSAEGTLTLATVQVAGLSLTRVSATLASKDGLLHIFPVEAQLDGGHYSGDITFDGRTATPAISIDEHVTGIDMTRLLATGPAKGRLSGRANLNIKATAHGAALDAILKTLNGHLDANLADGAIEGVDIGYELGQAQALIDRQPAPAGTDSKRTKFDAFRTSAQITNGIAETHDLMISSPILKVTGQGNANLPTKGLDFTLLASILKSSPTNAIDVPLKITGIYTDPTVRPDIEALAKGQLKNKLQDVLKKNGLDGLFGK